MSDDYIADHAPEKKGWIQTYTGKQFNYHVMRAEDVSIVDIAHHLSMLCRYAGACRFFYSVGEHSLHVSHVVPKELALAGLMHDATEAYCVDLPRPLKRMLPAYMEMEERVWQVIAGKYDLPAGLPPEVKLADTQMLVAEANVLFETVPAWISNYSIEPAQRKILGATPAIVSRSFLARFHNLTGGRYAEEYQHLVRDGSRIVQV